MRIVLWLVVAAALLYIGEEYAWPGGFLAFMRRVATTFTAGAAAPSLATVVNTAMVAGLVVAALVGPAVPTFALSGAALGVVNGLVHLAAAVHTADMRPVRSPADWPTCRPRPLRSWCSPAPAGSPWVWPPSACCSGWPTTWCQLPGWGCTGYGPAPRAGGHANDGWLIAMTPAVLAKSGRPGTRQRWPTSSLTLAATAIGLRMASDWLSQAAAPSRTSRNERNRRRGGA